MINFTIEPLQLISFAASSALDIIAAAPLPSTAIGDPIEWEERAFKPCFSPMTGRPWQPTQFDYLLLGSSISKYINFKI